jgi:hypothetical protein
MKPAGKAWGKCPTKITLILMSQMRDLLWEMVTELFWPRNLKTAKALGLEILANRARPRRRSDRVSGCALVRGKRGVIL